MSSKSRTREKHRPEDEPSADDRREGVLAARETNDEPSPKETKGEDDDTDDFYDEVVRGGPAEAGDEDGEDDAYEQLTRENERDVEAVVVEDLDPANLAATLEGLPDEGPSGEPIAPSALDEDLLEQEGDVERTLRPYNLDDEDDGGSISPEELGEQFLRGAAQQERRVARNDAESPADVDLLSDSVHQVSLFDHNQDPLGDPHLPEVVADETQADADHRPGERSSSKRAALHAAEDRSAALGAKKPSTPATRTPPKGSSSKRPSNNEPTSVNKPTTRATQGGAGTSKPKTNAQGTKATRSKGESKTTGAGGKTTSEKSDAKKADAKRSSVTSQKTGKTRATSKPAAGKTIKAESKPSDKGGSSPRRGRVASQRKSAVGSTTTGKKAASPAKSRTGTTRKARTQKPKPAPKAKRGSR